MQKNNTIVKIEILSNPTKNDLLRVNVLISQIAKKPHMLSMRELIRVTSQKENCKLVVARAKINNSMAIVGMAVVTLVYIPTGLIAMVEDAVVHEALRGNGLGRKLTKKLIEIAKGKKAKHISLYTGAGNVSANAMYQNMGFFKKEVSFYRINLFLPKPANNKEIKKIYESSKL